MTSDDATEHRGPDPARFQGALGGTQYFTLALGCMISSSWIVVLGEWLGRAGTFGAILGFLVGGLLMAGIASCYAELTAVMPLSGGDIVFADRVFGRDAAFFVGWFLVLATIAVASFEALSFVWVSQTLWPSLGGPPLYRILSKPVSAADIALGAVLVLSMHLCNRIGIGTSARVQDAFTALKLIVIAALIVTAMVTASPKLSQSGAVRPDNWFAGSLWIAGTSAFWLGGFQVISQAAEERRPGTSLRVLGRVIVGAVGIAVLVYCGLVLAASVAVPRQTLLSASLPAAAAAQAVFRSRWGAIAVLVAGLCGILTTLNAMMIAGPRLLFALARIGYLPGRLARTDRRGTPAATLRIVTIAILLGVLCGRGLLIPVVDMASMSMIISYVMVCAAVLRMRRVAPNAQRPFRLPGGTPAVATIILGATAMAVFVIAEPALHWSGIPAEWMLFGIWGLIGVAVWLGRQSHACKNTAQAGTPKLPVTVYVARTLPQRPLPPSIADRRTEER